MAFKINNLCFVIFFPLIITLISALTLTYQHYNHHHHHHHHLTASSRLSTTTGRWTLLHRSIGISAMHMQLLHDNKVIIFDRTDFGPSNLILPSYNCRRLNGEAVSTDCTAHSIVYDVASNTYRPLTDQTNVWCSSGAVNSEGVLVQTGGYHAGDRKIRLFPPCNDRNYQEWCDWIELPQNLTVQRWYATDHILPDGRVIILGGRRAFSYEFVPKNPKDQGVFYFPFLKETTDPKEENNLYPFVYLLPDGNLYVFANRRSVVLDYVQNKVVKKFPIIPGEKRTYPSTGSSVMLPLKMSPAGSPPFPAVDVVVCGGARGGSYWKAIKGVYAPASKSCGRIRVTDPDPSWVMEDMPVGRVMPDMVLLPTGHVLIVNGAGRGTAGWECAEEPVLEPLVYDPDQPDPNWRFVALDPSPIARLYHSSAILLPDGRVLIGGSNPHVRYNFSSVKYPTELSLEAFEPPYLSSEYAHLRPSIMSVEGNAERSIWYGQEFSVTFSLGTAWYGEFVGGLAVNMVRPAFSTHSFGMNQRLLELYVVVQAQLLSIFGYKVTVLAPPTPAVAPPGYYMLFVVHGGVPSHGVWVRIQ